MIVISKYLVPNGYSGLTIFPFVILKNKRLVKDDCLINHERIHIRQQWELLILPFYIIYGIEFLIRLNHYKNWTLAYRNISFEREAYQNENNLTYLKSRKFWGFLKYLRSHEFSA